MSGYGDGPRTREEWEMDYGDFIDTARAPEAPDIMDFTITRDREPTDDEGPLLSVEALGGLRNNMTAFVAARLMAHHERTGERTGKLVVRVQVSVNDASVVPMVGEFLWWESDDQSRPDGSQRR